jgi:hypothetical protein
MSDITPQVTGMNPKVTQVFLSIAVRIGGTSWIKSLLLGLPLL